MDSSTILVICGLIGAGIVFYLTATFEYEIDGPDLALEWRVLGVVPLRWTRIPLTNIEGVRKRSWRDALLPGAIFGNIFSCRGVLLVTRPPVWMRYVFITPPDPDLFIRELEGRLAAE
jgi:hypothetical protein